MRFAFKTAYEHDLGLFRDPVQRRWYAALLAGVILLPLAIPAYLSDMSMVFIYGLCGLSLMVLAGYTGLVSLGHAAFLGIGAYAHVYFTQDLGLPWIVGVALAAVAAAASGVLVGLPALRMTGVYLTIATLAFALIIQEVFTRWDRVTHGLKGRPVDKPVIFGVSFASDWAFYFLCLAVLIAGLWLTANLLRSPTGRAWVAIRDSEIAAQSMGVHLARYKTLAFAYSAGLMGAAGALFAHKIGFLAPDIFTRAPVHPVPLDGRGGRPRQPARRALRRGLRGAAAGAHLGGARSRARLGRPRRGACSARAWATRSTSRSIAS